MAPPPGIVEVRCAGCGETLEVEHGLTEFGCPDCGTAQALPPELMPPRPRRAVPLAGRSGSPFAATPSRVVCGGCGAVLGVPHGSGRCACPLCGAELPASLTTAVSVLAPPAAVPITLSWPAQPSEVHAGPSRQSTHAGQVQKPIHSEQTLGQHPRHYFREESFTTFRADTGTEIPVVGRLQNGPANPPSHREQSQTETLNETVSRSVTKKPIVGASAESFRARKMQKEHPNQSLHASKSSHTDKAEDRFPSDTITMNSKQNAGCMVVPSIIEHEQIKSLNHVNDMQQACEIPNNVVLANQKQYFATKAIGHDEKSAKYSKGNQKRKNQSLGNCSNELPHLRRSKRLVKGSPDQVDSEPIQKNDASPNQNQPEAPRIERILVDPDPSSTSQYRFPHGGSNELDDVDASTALALNRGSPQADQFPNIQMCSPETRFTLPIPSSNSWHEHEIPQGSFSAIDQLDRGYEEVHSNPSETENEDMDGQLAQEVCSEKNSSGPARLKLHNKNLSEHGRQKRNGFTGSSSNDTGHPGDWSISGTHHQTNQANLSASCVRLIASLPFPIATTLPTITSSSRENLPLNCSSPTLLHQQPPSSHYMQEAPCGDVLPGSVSSSAKKRRGRGPEKLMEPRKEADRPVLAPSGTDWSVHPPCPKVTSTISVLIKQKYPGTYMSDDTSGNGQPCEHVIYHWHQCPPDIRATILDEFLKRYKWSAGQEEECQKIFDRKAVRQLANLFCYEKKRVRDELAKKAKKSLVIHQAHGETELEDSGEDSEEYQGDESMVVPEHDDPLKWKPSVPRWMKPKWWEMLCDHWAKDEIMKLSYQQRKNRSARKCPRSTAGSPSTPMHQQLGMDSGGKLVFDIDSPTRTPSSKEFVDQKSCQAEDTTDGQSKEAGGSLVGSHPVQGQVGSWKRGRYCGAIGVSKKAQNESLSRSSTGCVSKQGQQPMFTKEQVQDMINGALQGLNEVWEKKFLSLEQKMPSMSASYASPDGAAESLLAVGRNKQCQLAREDTLDPAEGEKDAAGKDDGYHQVDEEHSSWG